MANEIDILSRWMNASGPTKVDRIFEELGVSYTERPTEGGESGWIECKDGEFKVVVNSLESPQRRRFTAGHELGHYLMHRDLMGNGERMHRHSDRLFESSDFNITSPFQQVHETQANKFAAQILMPAGKLSSLFDGGEKNVTKLANEFGVSKPAMEIRLKTLGKLP